MERRQVCAVDRLLICYELRHNGKLLEGGLDDEPEVYKMGAGAWPDVIENELLGKKQGTIVQLEFLPEDEVFGAHDPERIISMDLADFESEPELEALIEFKLPDDQLLDGQILSIVDDRVEVDFNHPYSGRALNIEIRIDTILDTL